MKNLGPERKLEAFKIFPYVAWMLILFFALFVYRITVELSQTVETLEETTISLQETIKTKDNKTINYEQ
jgi:uncharacterized membrane protein YdbT with pleckstrin-like domain